MSDGKLVKLVFPFQEHKQGLRMRTHLASMELPDDAGEVELSLCMSGAAIYAFAPDGRHLSLSLSDLAHLAATHFGYLDAEAP